MHKKQDLGNTVADDKIIKMNDLLVKITYINYNNSFYNIINK